MLPFVEPELDSLLRFLSQESEFVFLDTSRPDSENHQSLLFLEPIGRLVCRANENLIEYLEKLQRQIAAGHYLAGWVGYEFGSILEGGIENSESEIIQSGMVVADLGIFPEPLRFDHRSGENDFPLHLPEDAKSGGGGHRISNLRPNMTREEFVHCLGAVRDYIAAGDTYQVNYTMKLLFDFEGAVEHLYGLLRKNQSVGYGAFIRSRDENILSFSPELFFKKSASGITVRPMKGTAKRGINLEEEKEKSLQLSHDIKNRSENVMIVDLLRNDLARLMHGHGQSRVFVESLFDVESYESLLQMTSTIKAVAAEEKIQNLSLSDLFHALFPCGSVTGAPKIRTMQIIDELEKEPRGVYTGAIGYFGPDGSGIFNVPIRTIRLAGNKGEMGIGAGITYDSDPVGEWNESLLKGEFLTHSKPEFHLFETILYQPGKGYYLLEEHLARLASGAEYFKFTCNTEKVREILRKAEKEFGGKFCRVRLTLAKDGRTQVESVTCDEPKKLALPEQPQSTERVATGLFAFADCRIETDNPWRFYKTTMRAIYNEQYKQALEKGIFDYIFCNDRGEVTEGCITNIFIYNDGCYKTPPVSCGLLDGVMRRNLITTSPLPVVEEKIRKEDVEKAEAVYLCNSVRGVVRVELVHR